MRQSALERNDWPRFSGLTIGKVHRIRSEANMVDIMLFDGALLDKVQVIVPFASSRTGVVNLPVSRYGNKEMINKQDPLSMAKQTESDVFAVVGFIGNSILRPVVLGFLFPEDNELLCDVTQEGNEDGTMFLWKHESNVYVRVAKGPTKDKTPEIEISHPSGFFLKIGNSTTRTTISNYDEKLRKFKFKNPENDTKDPAPIVHLSHPSGTYLEIDAEGNVSTYVVGDVVRTVEGDVTDIVTGKWLRQSDTEIEDKAPIIHHNK